MPGNMLAVWSKVTSLFASNSAKFVVLLLLVLSVPLAVYVVQQDQDNRQRASELPLTPPSPTVTIKNPLHWETPRVSLRADDFYIIANGVKYLADVVGLQVQSAPTPGTVTFATLEAIWHEHGQEMRMFIYFASQNGAWRVSEVRTYGSATEGKWIYYDGFEGTPFGQSLTKPVFDLVSRPSEVDAGHIHFENFSLTVAPFEPTPTPTNTPTPTVTQKPTMTPTPQPNRGFTLSTDKIDVKIKAGDRKKVLDITPAGGKVFVFYGGPTQSTAKQIRWSPQAGRLIAGNTTPVSIYVPPSVKPGVYSGIGVVKDPTKKLIPFYIPVTITVEPANTVR